MRTGGRLSLHEVFGRLEQVYGAPQPPELTDPLDLVLWENVAYLVDDERRKATWDALCLHVGTRPQDLLAAPEERLAEVIRGGGMHPERRAGKLRDAASIALEEHDGDLRSVLALPVAKARRGLQRFPGLGRPGADKILLFTRTLPVLALDSNGLRVLVRLGFAEEQRSYEATYRAVQEALAAEAGQDFDRLIAGHQLLRRHGKELCKASAPECGACPLAQSCPAALAGL
jgi:endonuclease III